MAKRHDLSRNLIRIGVQKCEVGEFDDDAQAADVLQAYEARTAGRGWSVNKRWSWSF